LGFFGIKNKDFCKNRYRPDVHFLAYYLNDTFMLKRNSYQGSELCGYCVTLKHYYFNKKIIFLKKSTMKATLFEIC
jgi:hypothetical protein